MNHFVQADLASLHHASLRILSEIGVEVDHQGMRQCLIDRGYLLKQGRVLFPDELMHDTLTHVASSFTVYGRSLDHAIRLDGHRMWGTNPGIVPWIRDLDSGLIRAATLKDVASTTRLLDAMDNVHVVMANLVEATDVLPVERGLSAFAVTLANTVKPIFGPGPTTEGEARAVIDMAVAVRDGDPEQLRRHPLCIPFVCPISPLRFPRETVDSLIVLAQARLPISILSNPVLGLTAPYTLAGGIVLSHAEVLAGIAMVEEIAPGLPVLHHATPTIADMSTLVSVTGGPELGLMRSTVAALARWCGIPSSVHGLHTSSLSLDWQVGQEKALNGLQVALGKPDLLGGVGILANGMATAYEAIVADNEILGGIFHVMDGCQVNDDHLAIEVTARAIAGEPFLTQDHTIRHLRSGGIWRPRLALRHESGKALGGCSTLGMMDRAHELARNLLSEHRVPPLSGEIQAEFRQILGRLSQDPEAKPHSMEKE